VDEVDELEASGSKAPANEEGVLVIAKGSRQRKKLQAKSSMAVNFSRPAAGPLKITG
jgi:hypothetical protein